MTRLLWCFFPHCGNPAKQKEVWCESSHDCDGGGAFALNHGLAGQRAKPAARRRDHPRAQERDFDRHAGGLLWGDRLLRLRPRLDQRLLSPLLPMRALLVEGVIGLRERIEAA